MTSTTFQKARTAAAAWATDRPTASAPLVSSPISQTFFELYPYDTLRKCPFLGDPPEPPTRQDTEIKGFSKKSRLRLGFIARNSGHKIKTQFCMTYGDVWPINGRSLKADLNRFLASVKKSFPDLEYLWIAEFQTRGCPHFHLFSNIPLSSENHTILARKWHKIAGYGQDKHLRVHGHTSNFIEWRMNNGSYLCKYLDKEHQKSIPAGFFNFGRWWGNSRKLVPNPDTVDLQAISEKYDRFNCDEFGEIIDERDAVKQLTRTLGKYHEKRLGKYRKYSFFRKSERSYTIPGGRKIYDQLIEFWRKDDDHARVNLSGYNSRPSLSRHRGKSSRNSGYDSCPF